MKTLKRHVNHNYGGNASAYARSVGITPQAAKNRIDGGWVIVGGQAMAPTRQFIAEIERLERLVGEQMNCGEVDLQSHANELVAQLVNDCTADTYPVTGGGIEFEQAARTVVRWLIYDKLQLENLDVFSK